jgi:predicted transposase/invertase (TIGR01784 family)
MKSDPLFFRLFEESPNCFFRLIGRPANVAQRYDLKSIEYKSTSVRLDGVFLPRQPNVDPAYIWEAQTYPSDTVYANLMSKIGRFLEHGNPKQDWVAVVIYSNRSIEQQNLQPYRCLTNSDQLVRIYLDELPPAPPDNFELGALQLISAKPQAALENAKEMVPLVRRSKRPYTYQKMVIQFIETVIVHQFPQWSRKEIEKMLQVSDVRQTRVFQEGKEEGIEQVALQLIKLNRPLAEIVKATGLTATQVRKLKKKQPAVES